MLKECQVNLFDILWRFIDQPKQKYVDDMGVFVLAAAAVTEQTQY